MARTLPAKQHPFGHRAGSGAPPLGSPRVPREPKSLPAKKTVSFHLEVDDDSEGSSTSTYGGRVQSGTPDSLDFVAERPALPVRQAPTPSRAGPSTASWLSSPGSSQDHSVDVVHPGSPLLAGTAAGRRGEGVGEPPQEALGDAGGGAARGRCSGALRPPDQPGEPLDRALWQQACCDAGAAPGWRSGAQGPLAEEHPVRQAPGEAGSHGCAVAELAEGHHSQQEASGEGGGGNAVLPGSCSRAPPRDAPGVSCESKARLARKTVSFNLEVDDHSEGPPTCGGRVQSGTPDSLDFVAERPALPVRQAPTPSRAGPSTASWLSSPGSSQDHSVDVAHPGSPLLAGAAAGRRGEGVGEPPQEALGDAGGGAARGRCSGALRPPDQPGEPLDRALWQQACCDAGGAAPGWRSGAQGPLAEEHPVRQAPGEAGSHGCAVAEPRSGAPRSLAEGQHSQQEASGEGSAGVSAVLPGSCSEAPQRPSAERHRSQQEALRALQLLEERARGAAAALKSRPHRCTAATKWAFAHGVARGAPRIEAWGGGGRHASGAYDYLPGEGAQGPPTYQSASDPSQRLRLSPEGHWLVGSAGASEQQHRQWGYLRSAHPVEPGVLPHAVSEWDVVPGAGGGQPAASRVRFWLAETVRLEWQKARVASCDCPVVSVRGVGQLGDGLYDFVPREGSAGEPPAYQHQVQRNLWLYLASDQRWWVGTEEGLASRAPQGLAQSRPVQPGQSAYDDGAARCWAVCAGAAGDWVQQAVEVRPEPGEPTALDKWAEACRRAGAVELWGASRERGVYRPAGGGVHCGEPPAYQCEQQPDLWLYVADDWRWCIGPTASKDCRRPGVVLRSRGEAAAGVLPEEVAAWCEQGDREAWEHEPNLCFFRTEVVAEAWGRAREACAESPVVTLTGAPGGLEEYGGFYDFMPEATAHDQAPAFQHQIAQERWLYLGVDGRWCVGGRSDLDGRKPAGRVRSLLVRPGQLPTAAAWQVRRAQRSAWDNPSRFARAPFAAQHRGQAALGAR